MIASEATAQSLADTGGQVVRAGLPSISVVIPESLYRGKTSTSSGGFAPWRGDAGFRPASSATSRLYPRLEGSTTGPCGAHWR